MRTLHPLRPAALLAAAAIATTVGCASAPPLTAEAQNSLRSVEASVDRVSAQFDRTSKALAAVRDDWDTDPDKSIRAFAMEVGALESRIKEVGEPGSDLLLSRWDAQLRSILNGELATADSSQASAIRSAFDHADDRVADLRDKFAPVYSRMLEFREDFRQRSSGAEVESLLTELRRTTTDSKEVAKRFDQLSQALGMLAGGKTR